MKQQEYKEDMEEKYYRQIRKNWDSIAKPLDGMGIFEHLTAKIGQLQQTDVPVTDKNIVVVLCADNGIVEEGISQSDQSVTAVCAKNIARGRSTVGIMARSIGAEVAAIDIGINSKEQFEGVEDKKISCGTKNFAKEPAMTIEQVEQAIDTGKRLVKKYKDAGYGMIATGEMGIGNTTTSSAVAAALLGCGAKDVTGKGAGLPDEKIKHKIKIIDDALEKYNLKNKEQKERADKAYVLYVLSCVGGYDISGMCGIFLGGIEYGMPVVIDGFISMVAALAAKIINPAAEKCMIPSHISREPGALLLAKALGIEPVIMADMALGEGTGAVMMMSLINTANHVYKESYSFDEAGVGQYERYKTGEK